MAEATRTTSTTSTPALTPPSPPPPPPLPPPHMSSVQQTGGRLDKGPPVYLAQLEAAGPDMWEKILARPPVKTEYRPMVYFFYGTLAQPSTLQRILSLGEPPTIRPAKVVGYALTRWGDYPALVDGETGQEVTGVAYEVGSPEHELRLAQYETNAYEPVPCRVYFTDGEQPSAVSGLTFMYAGDAAALRAGRFDRRLWEASMGTRLPEAWRRKRDLVEEQMVERPEDQRADETSPARHFIKD
ncbi:hypothetical protein GGR56DRAFT_133916 [Xylariaceae sp. FL0804]|nr:hypothetical protein GGR56DRAFT_133916 [Xylariaceae sp. FL0804]